MTGEHESSNQEDEDEREEVWTFPESKGPFGLQLKTTIWKTKGEIHSRNIAYKEEYI